MMMISNKVSAAAARSKRARLLGVVALAVLIGAAALWRAPLSETVWRLLAPVMHVRFGSGEASLATSTDPSRLAAAEADRDALYQENLELKARLGRDARVTRILSGVLLRPPQTPYDTLVIDAGTAEGVALRDAVSAGGIVVVGTVSQVYAHASRVTLYSAPGEKYDALLKGSIPLAVEGQGGGSLQARLPAGTPVAVGDAALLPGIVGGISARVSHIERGAGESFITLYFTLPIDL
ncbi:MAG: rod shape-determining protein MreC, partial [Acidobacteriota bacterium]|nr:rod shape-determining protein MreC [Acidobacteriota bacterium]